MKFNVISEGLEIAHQTAQIMALGCEYGQGYIFSKPVDSRKASVLFENPGAAPAA
jgi:EAL domain-containing protein (putative c-di-GMP-specific phosphodiesterase class I)